MDIRQNLIQAEKLHDKFLSNIISKYPINDAKRIVGAETYLTHLMLNYKPDKYNLPSNIVRGICGEIMLNLILEYYKNYYSNFKIYHGLVIPRSDGTTTQLDTVVVSPQNIMVIEVKSIFGNIEVEQDLISSEYITKDNQPIITEIKPWNQNMMHIIELKNTLQSPSLFIHNCVFVFTIGDILKINPKPNNHLLTMSNSIAVIDHLFTNKNMGRIIPKQEMSKIISTLNQYIPTIESQEQHLRYLKQKFSN